MTETNTSAPNTAIIVSRSIDDVIWAAKADPAIASALVSVFGNQLAAAQKSPLGMLAGALIGTSLTRLGVSADPAVVAVAGGIAAILGGDLWQWAAARWWPAPAKISNALSGS